MKLMYVLSFLACAVMVQQTVAFIPPIAPIIPPPFIGPFFPPFLPFFRPFFGLRRFFPFFGPFGFPFLGKRDLEGQTLPEGAQGLLY